jgi:hypothetical protein
MNWKTITNITQLVILTYYQAHSANYIKNTYHSLEVRNHWLNFVPYPLRTYS